MITAAHTGTTSRQVTEQAYITPSLEETSYAYLIFFLNTTCILVQYRRLLEMFVLTHKKGVWSSCMQLMTIYSSLNLCST